MFKDIDIKKHVELCSSNINSSEYSLEDYVNLILVLWNASFDYGFESYCIAEEIFTADEISNFPKEIETLFDRAFNKFPDNRELQFWKIYIDDLNSYSECSRKSDMEDFLKTKDFHLPYFYMYVQCDILNNEKLEQLKTNLINEKNSYKKHYMLSYLEKIEHWT